MATAMRTIARYQQDATLRELASTVVSWQPSAALEESVRSLFKTVLDTSDGAIATKETIFHAQGGGQPSDRGTITAEKDPQLRFQVNMVRKLPSGVILHAGNFIPPVGAENGVASAASKAFQESEPVVLRVDNELRDYHSRLHTAGHIVSLAVRQLAGLIGAVTEGKANHAPGSSWVEFGGLIDGKYKAAIEDEANRMVALNCPVCVRWWDLEKVKEQCAAVPDGMTVPAGEELLRVVDIEGLGSYPCGGTHLPTTAEIGKVVIRKISRQKGVTKISYEVSPVPEKSG